MTAWHIRQFLQRLSGNTGRAYPAMTARTSRADNDSRAHPEGSSGNCMNEELIPKAAVMPICSVYDCDTRKEDQVYLPFENDTTEVQRPGKALCFRTLREIRSFKKNLPELTGNRIIKKILRRMKARIPAAYDKASGRETTRHTSPKIGTGRILKYRREIYEKIGSPRDLIKIRKK